MNRAPAPWAAGLMLVGLLACNQEPQPPASPQPPPEAPKPQTPWSWHIIGGILVVEGEVAGPVELHLKSRTLNERRACEFGPVRWELYKPERDEVGELRDGSGRLLARWDFSKPWEPPKAPVPAKPEPKPAPKPLPPKPTQAAPTKPQGVSPSKPTPPPPAQPKPAVAPQLPVQPVPPPTQPERTWRDRVRGWFTPTPQPSTPAPVPAPQPIPAKPEPKAALPAPRPEPKPLPKPEPKPEPKPTPKPEPKAAPKPEPKPAPAPKPEPKREPERKPPVPPPPIPTPKPLIIPEGTWPGAGTGLNLLRGPSGQRRISLTFDGGSNAEVARDVLEALKRHHIRTTFFLTGDFIQKFPDLVRRIVAEGHEVGNHTMTHPHFAPSFRRDPAWTRERFQQELLAADQAFLALTGRPMDPLWRAPYGEHTAELRKWAEELGYRHVGWSEGADTLDWATPKERKLYRTGNAILDRLHARMNRQDGDGLIVLMHLGSERPEVDRPTRILGDFIAARLSEGWQFVPIRDYLRDARHPSWDPGKRLAWLNARVR